MTPAELAINNAVQAVEAAGCDTRLTEAINLLHAAREKVADFVDAVPTPPPSEQAAVRCPACGRAPVNKVTVNGVDIYGCPCMPKDQFVAVNEPHPQRGGR